MKGLSNLGTGLIVVFVVCLLLLLAEVFYVLWYRRRFRRDATLESDASGKPYTTTTTNSPFTSKELMYLFCWNSQSWVKPASAPTAPSMDQEDTSSESEDPLKWHVLYGQSRLLFTIKEEEKEDLESVKSSSMDPKPNPDKKRKISLSECFERTQEEEPPAETNSVVVDVEERESTTPFSTPCASPPYFTPSPSPTRDAGRETGSVSSA